MNATDNNQFISELQKLWSTESMLVEAMPRMIKKASTTGLQKTLALHFAETDQHKVAIEAICKQLNIDPSAGEPATGLQTILQQGEMALMNQPAGNETDLLIIETALQVEQLEIESYEPAGDSAASLGYAGIARRLRLTLEEERQSDTKLRFLKKGLYSESAEIGPEEVEAALKTY